MRTTLQTIPLKELPYFSKTFLDYIEGSTNLSEFYNLFPAIENFPNQITQKKVQEEQRQKLVTTLLHQYKNLPTTKAVTDNIDSLLKPNTFTVTTGHQLNLFGGPLYFIYKIITTINTAEALNKKDATHHVVPVFWMASEDHDFEEINHFNLFGKTWQWETTQKGAVGRFEPESIKNLLASLPEKLELFEQAYTTHKTLSEATRFFVNELFGHTGLLIIDADDKNLKQEFIPVLKDEILHQTSRQLVEKTSKALEEKGYEAQIHAREINLFYLDNNLRERIIKEGEYYKVHNTDIKFSEKEILAKIENEPERFSPNVVLRPLYQECILPNLAYIGGPAEVIYWLQLKSIFDYHHIPFPILMPRNFGLYITKGNVGKLSKLSLSIQDLFPSAEIVKNNYLLKITSAEFKLLDEQEELKKIFSSIKTKASAIDKTMEATVMAEQQKGLKILEELEKKLKKAEERKNETALTQLLTLKEKLFPAGGLQERSDNFLSFYLNDSTFLSTLQNSFDPFNYSFCILSEHE